MFEAFRDLPGNPSSIHSFGRDARKALEDSRDGVADFLGASPDEIFFTSGGTEADNLAILGTAAAAPTGESHLITSSIEHPAVLTPCRHLEKQGFSVTYLPVDGNGLVDPADLRRAITAGTFLVSIMHSNNEVGTLEPIVELAAIASEHHIPFHTDAVQSAGKLPLSVRDLGVELLSISAHKMGGPRGVGALYVQKGVRVSSLFHAGHQERDLRPGTENLHGAIGLAAACRIAAAEAESQSARLRQLRDSFESEILSRIPDVVINAQSAPRLPGTSSVTFLGLEGEMLLLSLDVKGIAASTGSACASGSSEPSHVLAAMGLPPENVRATLRFSFGRTNTPEEVPRAVTTIEQVVSHLRQASG